MTEASASIGAFLWREGGAKTRLSAYANAQTLEDLYESRVQTDNGFDISFNVTTFPDGSEIILEADCPLSETETTSSLHIIRDGTDIHYTLYNSTVGIETFTYPYYDACTYRILFHGQFITVYIDNYWVHTFYPEIIYYPEIPTVLFKGVAGGGSYPVLANLVRKDLYDWRAAIWIDMETSSQNAISSILQQRPVEIFGSSDGAINFLYEREDRPEVTMSFIRRLSRTNSENGQLASDAIVYYTNVKVKVDQTTANNYGFITRMYRMPELDSGAIRAARLTMRRARQNSLRSSFECRINPALEIGDVAIIDVAALSGTSIPMNMEIIVEGISIAIRDGNYVMRVDGRKNE